MQVEKSTTRLVRSFLRLHLHSIPVYVILLLCLTGGLANAQYVPGSTEPPKEPSTSNGSRDSSPFVVFAPQSHVGRSANPNFELAWFVDAQNTPYNIEIVFYNAEQEQVYIHQDMIDQGGLVRQILPGLSDVIEFGQQYTLEVVISSSVKPGNQSSYQSFTSEMEIIPPSSELIRELAEATSREERSNLYA